MDSKSVLRKLQSRGFVPEGDYDIIRRNSPRICHDAIIYLPGQKKILLAVRQQEPSKGDVWPFGGGQKMGFPMKDSLKKLIEKESGLAVALGAQFFGKPVDHLWSKGPKGEPVHDVGNYYTILGCGEISPDKLNKARLITGEEYMDTREDFAHWTKVGMDRAVERFFGIKVKGKTVFKRYYVDAIPVFN